MLKQEEVGYQEEAIRNELRNLTENERDRFYSLLKPKLRDPDTYAVLNWFFITGIHHFYLGRWLAGCLDLGLYILGIMLAISGMVVIGITIIVAVTVIEFWALFRSQIIVQDWNNRKYVETLLELKTNSSSR